MPAPSPATPVGVVSVLGSSDLPGLGDQVVPRVVEQQLSRRLPGWRLDPRAPLGRTRPSVTDGGLGALPLPVHDGTSVRRLARSSRLDVVCPTFPVGISGTDLAQRYGLPAVAGAADWFGEGLPAEVAAEHPTCWTAVRVAEVGPDLASAARRAPLLAVRDRHSRDLLREAGVDNDITVVAHPGLFAGDLVTRDVLDDRRTMLRRLGLLPPTGTYVVVHLPDPAAGPAGLAEAVEALRDEVGVDHVVVLPETTATADPTWSCVLPPDLVVEDRLAVLAGAELVVATDEHGAAVSAGLAVRWVLLDPDGQHRAAVLEFGWAHQVAERPDRLSAAFHSTEDAAAHKDHSTAALADFFDRLAELAEQTVADDPQRQRGATDIAAENDALRFSNERLRERVLLERGRLVEPLVAAMAERDDALARLAEATEREQAVRAELARYEQELTAWRDTKLVRWSTPLREAYGKIRER